MEPTAWMVTSLLTDYLTTVTPREQLAHAPPSPIGRVQVEVLMGPDERPPKEVLLKVG